MLFSGDGIDRPIRVNSDGSSVCPNRDGLFQQIATYVEAVPLKDKSAVLV